jgi:hypothetical protein
MKNELKMKVNIYRKSTTTLVSKGSGCDDAASLKDSILKQRKKEANRPLYLNRYE